jgi:hypothetical protein
MWMFSPCLLQVEQVKFGSQTLLSFSFRLRKVGGYLRVLRCPPIKLTATIKTEILPILLAAILKIKMTLNAIFIITNQFLTSK